MIKSGVLNDINTVQEFISIIYKIDYRSRFDVSEKGPDSARSSPNSSMIGLGITMEGINQNELIYEFLLEKAWRSPLDFEELLFWSVNAKDKQL